MDENNSNELSKKPPINWEEYDLKRYSQEFCEDYYAKKGKLPAGVKKKRSWPTQEHNQSIASAGGRATQKIFRSRGHVFHDPTIQRELAERSWYAPDMKRSRSIAGKAGNKAGKAIGGANALSTERRQEIGQASGRASHANKLIKAGDTLQAYLDNKPVLTITDCCTGGDVVKILNKYTSEHGTGHKPLSRVTAILKDAILRRDHGPQKYKKRKNGIEITRKSMHGWSLEFI